MIGWPGPGSHLAGAGRAVPYGMDMIDGHRLRQSLGGLR